MGLRIHVGVHAHGDRRPDTHLLGPLVDQFQFLGGFDVQHENARFQGIVDLFRGFAHTGIDDPGRGESGLQPPVELAP